MEERFRGTRDTRAIDAGRREYGKRGVAFDDTALATLKGGRHRFDEIQGTAFTVQRKTVG